MPNLHQSSSAASHRYTLVHVTHEAVEQLGGIGTVLEGLMCSPAYQERVGRSILIGPTSAHLKVEPENRLGEHGQVLYSSIDQIDKVGLAGKFRPVEWAFNVAIVDGKRQYAPPGQGRTGEAEVLLIDVFRANPDRLNVFKLRLWEMFGLDSGKYEKSWEYEEYVRLAEPAFYALEALLGEKDLPCMLFAHEYMGMPAALQAILDGGEQFRTIFHAHECASARRIVEKYPGHDTMFYNILDHSHTTPPPTPLLSESNGGASEGAGRGREPRYIDQIFGSQDSYLRHALISRSHLCDGIIAVGDRTRDELYFLDPKFAKKKIDLVYNGLPAMPVTLADKHESRAMLIEYAKQLVGYEPDVLMTHVTRPVISKGLWRDMKVCHHLAPLLAAQGKTAVLFILTSAGGVRRPQDVAEMESTYGWPRQHREGFPDLVGPEVNIHRMVEPFNADHPNVQIVLVNQFGWSRQRIGKRLPAAMHIGHLRVAADVEFGMATYEPFGISPLEPLGAGAICVISNVCGCDGFVQAVTAGKGVDNVVTADFTQLAAMMPPGETWTIEQLKAMTDTDRDVVEERETGRVAHELMRRLPNGDDDRQRLINAGQGLVQEMGWDQVVENELIPLLDRLAKTPTVNGV